MASDHRRRSARSAVAALLVALPVSAALCGTAHAADGSGSSPPPRTVAAASSVSESATGGPTQSFVLGSVSLDSLSSSTDPVMTASPTARPSSGDLTGHYVHLFFGVIIAAALLLAAGITGLILTRDGRYSGGRHR